MSNPLDYRPDAIPTDPGVYRFFDQNDRVIYVGKAKNLKNRLGSYFQKNLGEKTYRMVHTAVRVDWTIVKSEVEALQLEFTWIKSENPEFNVQFKDDKSYPYLAISISDEFPRIFISREKKRKGNRYFGPYAHAWALRSTLDTLIKLFPIRSCSESNFQKARRTNRQCLYGDIGKCSAPCVGWVTPEEHKADALKLISFLEKKPEEIIGTLEGEMQAASTSHEFERAGRIRDQISALTKASESTAGTLNEGVSGDFIAIHEEITHAAATLFIVRSGRVVGSRSWVIELEKVLEDEEVMASVLSKIYRDFDPPSEIYVDRAQSDFSSYEQWLSETAGKRVKISVPQRGEKYELIQTVERNAHQALIRYLSKRANDSSVSGRALEEIAEYLDLDRPPLRMESFDISNIQGEHMVASMVVFEDGQPKKSEYRRFSISSPERLDDTRAMHQVLTRRLKRYLDEKDLAITDIESIGAPKPKFAYAPQLIVVDGGKPQVEAAARVLEELGITNIALCGLAKRLEEVWLPGSDDPIIFPRHSEALYLLQRLRDEAHRFAITFHRSKRSKVMLDSLLDEVSGLGEMRRRALLERYGSVSAIKKATAAELSAIPGIGEKVALSIFDHLQAAESASVDMKTGEILDS